jgi:hypothetical protein
MSKAAPGRGKKYFNIEQANQMLPLLRAILRDIVELAHDLQQREERLSRIQPGQRNMLTEVHQEECQQMELELGKDAARLEEYVDELRRLGVELKGWDGLVDFPAWMDDREVYLCWKLGEPEVAHWHEIDAGFAGRQRLLVAAPAGGNLANG